MLYIAPTAATRPVGVFNRYPESTTSPAFARGAARMPLVTPSTQASMATIVVNGAPRALPAPATVAGLVLAMGLEGKRIAVERNGEIVPRSKHADTELVPGDRVEIVGAVGGG